MDPDTPLYETMWALDSIVKSGKALYVGLSNYDGATMEKATEILESLHCPYIINQNNYSMLNRNVEQNGILEKTILHKKGMIVFSPLAQGLLSGRYLDGIPEGSRIKSESVFLNENSLSAELLEKLKKLNEVAINRGQTLAQMALAWLYAHEGVTSVLIGASSPQQILENIKMLDNTKFDSEELELIDKIILK